MTDGIDERLFQRYQSHGDVDALAQVFDRTAPTLLRLALHLARGPVEAEDLLQETFVAAIETGARYDHARPLLPWLAGILANKARWLRWREGRAPDPKRVPLTAPPDPSAEAEQKELHAAVDAAISELPETYRAVLRLHLVYGHGPGTIAHALERSPGTVRSQLARGLELLRKALPGGLAGGMLATVGAERGLAAVRAAVLQHAVAHAVPAAVGIGWLGGLVVMKKSLVAAVGLVAAALAGLAAWNALGVGGAESRAGAGSQPLVVAAKTDVRADVSTPGTASRVAAPEGARPSAADQVGEIEVVALDAATLMPIAGAEIRGPREPCPELRSSMTFLLWTRQNAPRLGVTGADGTARVSGQPVSVLAVRVGERYGEAWLGQALPARVEVRLAIERGVTIRAVDSRFGPVAGLPIGARTLHRPDERVMVSPVPLGVADANGELWVPLSSMLAPELGFSRSVAIVPYAPCAWAQGGTTVSLDPASPAVITLTVPALGTLRCELLDSEGQPFRGPTPAFLDEARREASGTVDDPDWGGQQWHEVVNDGSIVTWPFFGLGWRGEVYFSRRDINLSAVGDGPKADGEVAVIRAQEPVETSVLVGRVLLPGGLPFAGRDVDVFYRVHLGSGSPRVRTDSEGRFRLGIGPKLRNWTLERLLFTPSAAAGQPRPALACQLLPGRPLQPGRCDLGDLVLTEPPILCTGRVVGEGVDLARVGLAVETSQPATEGARTWNARPSEGVFWWRDTDGSFTARGFGFEGPLRLRAVASEAAEPALVPFDAGARELVVALRRAGSVFGWMDTLLDGHYQVELVGGGERPRTAWCGRGERFAWTGLRPGPYAVRVLVPGDPEPLVTFAEVQVAAGVETRDPRLSPVRLEVPLRMVPVVARGPDGTTRGDGVVLVDWGGTDGVGAFPLERGRATVHTRRPVLDLWVCATGFPPVLVRGARDAVQVELQDPRMLELQLRTPSLPAGFVLVWDFELMTPDTRSFYCHGSGSVASWFGHGRRLEPRADGSCRAPLLSTAAARVICHVQRDNSSYWWSVPVTPATLPPGELHVDVTVSAEAVADAIAHFPDRAGQDPIRR